MEIDEILNKLLGDIMPVASQSIDNERYENIINWEQAFETIICELIECAKWKDDYRYSANRIGKRTYNLLKRTIDDLEDELRIIDESKGG